MLLFMLDSYTAGPTAARSSMKRCLTLLKTLLCPAGALSFADYPRPRIFIVTAAIPQRERRIW